MVVLCLLHAHDEEKEDLSQQSKYTYTHILTHTHIHTHIIPTVFFYDLQSSVWHFKVYKAKWLIIP